MNTREDILNELKSIAPALISLRDLNVFKVPAGYFDNFSSGLFNEIHLQDYSVLPVEALNMMNVPAGYFDTLADNILARIKSEQLTTAEELKDLSPALVATGNDNVFTVPARYFEDLPEIILSRVNRPAKVIVMKSRISFSRYAAAAIVTGVLGLSLFSLFNKNNQADIMPGAQLTASVMAEAKNIIQTNSFEKKLETISDNEIVDYLENTGQDVEAALVATVADTKELPSEDAYIINDNTLNDFLKDLNLNDYSN